MANEAKIDLKAIIKPEDLNKKEDKGEIKPNKPKYNSNKKGPNKPKEGN
jgi:hypothetical protein